MTRHLAPRLASIATALALLSFAASVARHHPDAATATETGLLALLAGLVLGALALGSRTAPAVVTAGSLVGMALVMPAADGSRGALVAVVLVAAAAWSAWRTFRDDRPPGVLDVAAVAIAWQALLRCERLLDAWPEGRFGAEPAVWLLALPLAAAAAAAWIARHQGPARALIALAALLLLVPGAGVVPVAVLVVLAAAAGGRPRAPVDAAFLVAACVVAIGRLPEVALPLLVLVAAVALGGRAGWRWLPAAGAATLAVARGPDVLAHLGWDGLGWAHLGWLALALPAAFSLARERWPLAAAGLALALAHSGGEPAALAPAVALLLLAVPEELPRERWQAGWSLALLGWVAILACYPWLRRPVLDLPSHVAGWPVAALAAAAIALAAVGGHPGRLSRAVGGGLVPAALGAGALLRPPLTLLPRDAVTLTAERTFWTRRLDGRPLRRLTLDSFLAESGGLAPGAEVATVRLLDGRGGRRELVIRQGEHTADWAAPQLGPAAAPPPWIVWLAADGSRAWRYRAVWSFDAPLAPERITIVRHGSLGPAPRLAVVQVGLE